MATHERRWRAGGKLMGGAGTYVVRYFVHAVRRVVDDHLVVFTEEEFKASLPQRSRDRLIARV